MIEAGIQNAADFIDGFAALAPRAADALRREAEGIADDLRDAADRNLSGAVLKQRTGALRASLRASVEDSPALSILVAADTPYAAFQEYGFAGAESVRAHLCRQTVAFGRPISPRDVAVRAFTRRIDYPAHSYLRAAVAEIAPSLQGRLAAAFNEALQP
jgi:phage gpG-like protein